MQISFMLFFSLPGNKVMNYNTVNKRSMQTNYYMNIVCVYMNENHTEECLVNFDIGLLINIANIDVFKINKSNVTQTKLFIFFLLFHLTAVLM